MACGLPVVTTSLGLGSIKAKPNEEIIIADTEEAFTKAVISLLTNSDAAKRIGDRGRYFVLKNHSWENAANQVQEIYRRVLHD